MRIHVSGIYIYHVYTVCHVYTMCIHCIHDIYLLFSGCCSTHRLHAPPSDGLEDNVPDVHDEADFDIQESACSFDIQESVCRKICICVCR
jgi:hypothetical protein